MTPGDTRRKNANWVIGDGKSRTVSSEDAALSVLMDVRDELQTLNRLLHCPNFLGVPAVLRNVAMNTKRIPPRKRKRKLRRTV
jgi:hypothetical protein